MSFWISEKKPEQVSEDSGDIGLSKMTYDVFMFRFSIYHVLLPYVGSPFIAIIVNNKKLLLNRTSTNTYPQTVN